MKLPEICGLPRRRCSWKRRSEWPRRQHRCRTRREMLRVSAWLNLPPNRRFAKCNPCWYFSVNYLRCRYLLLSGGSREASLSICYSLLARGETERDNGGCGYDIAKRLLVRVRNHEAFRTSFGTKRFYYCVLHARKINQLLHNCTLSPRMSVKLDTHWVVASRIPNRLFAVNCRLRR